MSDAQSVDSDGKMAPGDSTSSTASPEGSSGKPSEAGTPEPTGDTPHVSDGDLPDAVGAPVDPTLAGATTAAGSFAGAVAGATAGGATENSNLSVTHRFALHHEWSSDGGRTWPHSETHDYEYGRDILYMISDLLQRL